MVSISYNLNRILAIKFVAAYREGWIIFLGEKEIGQMSSNIANVLFQANLNRMPRESSKVRGSYDFCDGRKAEMIRTRELFQQVTPKRRSVKGQLDHMNNLGWTNKFK